MSERLLLLFVQVDSRGKDVRDENRYKSTRDENVASAVGDLPELSTVDVGNFRKTFNALVCRVGVVVGQEAALVGMQRCLSGSLGAH